MKLNLIFFYILFSVTTICFAQNYYQQMYDDKGYDTKIENSLINDHDTSGGLSWRVGEHMESLLDIYELSNDHKYLNTLIRNMGRVMDRRDDLRDGIGLPNIEDYRGIIGPVWATNYYNDTTATNADSAYAHIITSANITYPMAKFAALVKNESSTFQNTLTTADGRYSGLTYLQIANLLIARVEETISYHEDQWVDDSNGYKGWYRFRCNGTYNPPIHYECEPLPMNMLAKAGRLIIQMYRATNNFNYYQKVVKLSNYIKCSTHLNNGYNIWRYWPNTNNFCLYDSNILRDDIAHAGLTTTFALECYEYGLTYLGTALYDIDDMKQYAKTFTDDIYQDPLILENGVDYSLQYWNFKTNTGVYANSQYQVIGNYIMFDWLAFSQFSDNEKIFQMIHDFYTADFYNTQIITFEYLKLAKLAKYSKHIIPYASNHNWGAASDWSAVACGNFDVSNVNDEFVYLRNYDGSIRISRINNDDLITSVASTGAYNATYNWSGVAAGDFYGNNEEEFVAVSNHSNNLNNGYYVFSRNGVSITEDTKSVGWGTGSDWAGVAAGNFISGGKDEFIVIRNYQHELRVCNVDTNNNINTINLTSLNLLNDDKIVSVASGNLDSDDNDELVILVNNDNISTNNGYFVYDINSDGSISLINSKINTDVNSDWNAVTIGDFDGDCIGEILVHKNSDGNLSMKHLNELNERIEYFPVNQTINMVIAAGNLDANSNNDELIMLRNFDAGIVAYKHNSQNSISCFTNKNNVSLKNDINKTNDLNLLAFPNPTSSTIEFKTMNNTIINKLELFNTNGLKILSSRENMLDLTQIKSGIYFCKVWTNNGMMTKRIIKK